MNLTSIRAGAIGILLAMGFAHSSSANAQSTFSLEQDRAKIPKAVPVKKTSTIFKVSEFYLAGGTAFDATTTVKGLDHSTTASMSNGTPLTHYYVKEIGWAGFLGDRDPWTAVAANVFLNYEIDRYSRKLYLRGGHWRAFAVGAILAKGTLNVISASNNIRDDERIDQKVRLATGYRGLIVWSH